MPCLMFEFFVDCASSVDVKYELSFPYLAGDRLVASVIWKVY